MTTLLPKTEAQRRIEVLCNERDTLAKAFKERTEALARSADECIRLTNERDSLRAALRALMDASVAREVIHTADNLKAFVHAHAAAGLVFGATDPRS